MALEPWCKAALLREEGRPFNPGRIHAPGGR